MAAGDDIGFCRILTNLVACYSELLDTGAIDFLSVEACQDYRGQDVSQMQQAYRQQVKLVRTNWSIFFVGFF